MTMNTVSITVTPATSRWGVRDLELTPGVVDEAAVELFGFSHCHLLALALHERFGWPLVVVEVEVGGRWVHSHSGVEVSGGRVVDVFGVRPVGEFGVPLVGFVDGGRVRVRHVGGFGAWAELKGVPVEAGVGWWRSQGGDGAALEGLVWSFGEVLVGWVGW